MATVPNFADDWNARTVGSTYGNGAQAAIGPPIINDWGSTGIVGFANWTYSGFEAEILADGFKGSNAFNFISAAGIVSHQTSFYYDSFSIFCLIYPTVYGNLVGISNKDSDPTKPGNISLFVIRAEPDGSISLFTDFTDTESNVIVDNSINHTPYAVLPTFSWSLLQVNVTLSPGGGSDLNVSAHVEVSLNGQTCVSQSFTSGVLISSMFNHGTSANYFSFYGPTNGIIDNISMYGLLTLGIWPDYDAVPDGTQEGLVTQAVTEVLERVLLTDTECIVTQAVAELLKFPKTTAYITQAVIELIKGNTQPTPPPPPGSSDGWLVKEI